MENFLTMVRQKSDIDRSRGRQYPEALLLGGPVQDIEEAARQASPVTWVSKDDPPFLTGHGFAAPEVERRVKAFLAKHLLGRDVGISDAPIKPAR